METQLVTKEQRDAWTPAEVLQQLKDGNARFVRGERINRNYGAEVEHTSTGQQPRVTVLGCADSRVPSEIVFDMGIGDVFNIRVAGNIANGDILGTMEFGTKLTGTKVMVILGHTGCGAVKGAYNAVEMGNLTGLVNKIKPAVEEVKAVSNPDTDKDFLNKVSAANVRLTIQNILDESPIVKEMVDNGELMLIGAMYHIDSGKVDFFTE